MLDDYTPHLQQRWAAGVTDAVALTAEITALGYRGTVNRIKMIKRQMFGRANFNLLNKRVLLTT